MSLIPHIPYTDYNIKSTTFILAQESLPFGSSVLVRRRRGLLSSIIQLTAETLIIVCNIEGAEHLWLQ